MQASSVLNGLNAMTANQNQRNIALAQIVKETIEGILIPSQIYVFAKHAISEGFQLDGYSVVTDRSVESSVLTGTTLSINADFDTPTANDYLNIMEGVGRVLSPNIQFRHELQSAGMNWVNSYGNTLFKAFLTESEKSPLLASYATELLTLLRSAYPLTVDQYQSDTERFVTDFSTAALEGSDLYVALRLGALKTLFDDSAASTFATIYYSLRYGNNTTGQYTQPNSAEFMSGYIFECLGAI